MSETCVNAREIGVFGQTKAAKIVAVGDCQVSTILDLYTKEKAKIDNK